MKQFGFLLLLGVSVLGHSEPRRDSEFRVRAPQAPALAGYVYRKWEDTEPMGYVTQNEDEIQVGFNAMNDGVIIGRVIGSLKWDQKSNAFIGGASHTKYVANRKCTVYLKATLGRQKQHNPSVLRWTLSSFESNCQEPLTPYAEAVIFLK